MEDKLNEFRLRKRRQEKIQNFKEKFLRMFAPSTNDDSKVTIEVSTNWKPGIVVRMKQLWHVELTINLNIFKNSGFSNFSGWRRHRQRICDIRYRNHRRNSAKLPVLVDIHNMACLFSYMGYALRHRHRAEVRNRFLHVLGSSWNLLEHACKAERQEGSERVQRL